MRGRRNFAPNPAVVLSAIALTACAARPQVATPRAAPVVYQVDRTGAAARCEVAPPPADGAPAAVTMRVGNDGGWCAVRAEAAPATPYAAGLLTGRPAHGSVTIHTVGYDTRIDYVPQAGYAGPDAFAVALLPGHVAVRATVTVAP